MGRGGGVGRGNRPHQHTPGCDPGRAIADVHRFSPYRDIPYQTFVKGDGRFGNIAAASILAKTHRDEEMRRLALQYPGYGWEVNKGYPTVSIRFLQGATSLVGIY